MNKKQYIEKTMKELTNARFTSYKELNSFLQSALSECWDMAGTEMIKKMIDHAEESEWDNIALDTMMTALTSQKEDKHCENCGTEDQVHHCVDCEQDISAYTCSKNSGMCHHCQWLIGK